jgi:hypothetical protein
MAVNILEGAKTDLVHYRNLLKIFDWDGYSEWDDQNQEMMHYLWMYRKYVIAKEPWDIGIAVGKLCEILGYNE